MTTAPQPHCPQVPATGEGPEKFVVSPLEMLELDSRLSELSKVRPWLESLADSYGLAADLRFAIHLCLEESLANLVIHAYRNQPGHPIVVRSSFSTNALYITVEDRAPAFIPVDPRSQIETSPPVSLESMTPGGNGIRLIFRFAGSVAYESSPEGNRLTLGFPVSPRDSSL